LPSHLLQINLRGQELASPTHACVSAIITNFTSPKYAFTRIIIIIIIIIIIPWL
jgi:hypothetical protein